MNLAESNYKGYGAIFRIDRAENVLYETASFSKTLDALDRHATADCMLSFYPGLGTSFSTAWSLPHIFHLIVNPGHLNSNSK